MAMAVLIAFSMRSCYTDFESVLGKIRGKEESHEKIFRVAMADWLDVSDVIRIGIRRGSLSVCE
jgi:hypothetical protein